MLSFLFNIIYMYIYKTTQKVAWFGMKLDAVVYNFVDWFFFCVYVNKFYNISVQLHCLKFKKDMFVRSQCG